MKKKLCFLTILLLIFSVSLSWAIVQQATEPTSITESTLPKIIKAASHPIIPEGAALRSIKHHQVAPIDDEYVNTRSDKGGVETVWAENFELEDAFWYYTGASIIWTCPDEYPEFAVRFTPFHNGTLDGTWIYFYGGDATEVTINVYDDDGTGYPGTLLGSLAVDPAAGNTIDLSSLGITLTSMQDFYIGFTVTSTGSVNFISDDASGTAERSLIYDGTDWVYAVDDPYCGAPYEWCIDAIVSYNDPWTTATGDWLYLEDSPTAKDTVSHSPTHCWWIDEGVGYTSNALVSPTFNLASGYNLYFISMWINIEFFRTVAPPGYIDETYRLWIVDTDDTITDFWHPDTLNHYEGEKSWWCGKVDPAWAGGWGYGNNWNQWIETPDLDLSTSSPISLDFMQRYDVELGYDYCYLEISTDNWGTYTNLATYNGTSNTWTAEQIDLSSYANGNVKIRFRFVSDSGWSDEDGDDTQGAWFIDNVVISDGTTIFFEDNADDEQNFLVNPGNLPWEALFYDYDRDYPAPSTGWEIVDKNTIFNGTCDITDYADKNIKLKVSVTTDDSSYVFGAGFFVDDIDITGISLPEFDMECDFTLVPYPSTVGLDIKGDLTPKVIMHQAGYGSSSADIRIDVEGAGYEPPLYDYFANNAGPLVMDEYGIFDLTRTPGYTPAEGTYNYLGWVEAAGDIDYADPVPVQIYPEGEYELGYNSRVVGQFYYPGCTGALTYFSPYTDEVLTGTHNINGIRHFCYNRNIPGGPAVPPETAPLTFKVYEAASPTTLGALLYEEEIDITTWLRYQWKNISFTSSVPVSNDFFILITGEFINGITTTDHPEYFMLVDDNTAKYFGDVSYYDGHAFNFVSVDALEAYPNDFYCNALMDMVVGVNPGHEPEVATYLNQNFPNPVTSNTNISFNLKANSDVKISVFNIKGQLVETLVDNEMEKGPHTLTWNSKSLSNGIYFLRLKTQETTITKKMLIIR